MLAALLMMALLGSPQASPAPPPPAHAGAVALANEGRLDAALDAFRRIASANPGDHEARLWIARLHDRMGHPDLAEPVYRSVLLEDPSNVDAMLGVGTTLLALGETEDAVAMLERAERAQPQHADVLDALGRAHTQAGRPSRALLYAERAQGLAPTDAHRRALEQARSNQGHRVALSSFGEDYNTATSNTGNVDLRANVRLQEDLRLIVRGQHQRKFGYSEQRGGGGLEWRWHPPTRLFGQVLAGPSGNEVLPRVDAFGEIAHSHGSAEWAASYRFVDFPSARVSVISPGVTWWPSDEVSLAMRYHLSFTDHPTTASLEAGNSFVVGASRRLTPRVWMNAGYARGTEDFDTLSPDRVGDFRANTVSGGLRLDFPSLTSLLGTYEYQWRPSEIEMQRLSVSIVQRF